MRIRVGVVLGTTWLALAGSAAFASGWGHGSGAVYTITNAAGGNSVLAFERASDGTLTAPMQYATGGTGTGAGLGSQGAVILSRNDRYLLAVNPGSDDVSVFRVKRNGQLELTDRTPSGGDQPISVTMHGRVVYVLNAGSDSITGFFLGFGGNLHKLPNSTRPLSAKGTQPAQIEFSKDGESLVVTEKATNSLSTYRVRFGYAHGPRVIPSNGMTPFGFAFGRRDHLFVSEAFGGATDASAVSSYDAEEGFRLVSGSVGTTETAACWVVITGNGRYAYVTNTGSGSVSGYRIAFDGRIELLNPDGRTGDTGTGSTPIDAALSDDSRFLYVLNAGHSTIAAFRVQEDGSLTPLGTVPVAAGANGLAAE